MPSRACILGCEGPVLSEAERRFFQSVRPWGFILFARNIQTGDQTRALIAALRESVGDDQALVFVDQEGGRVQRLRPPLARLRAPADGFGQLYEQDANAAREAVWLNHRLLAHEVLALGFNADCAPCLDLRHPGAHDIIGDRAFGQDPKTVARLGQAAMDGLVAGGVAPVIKHIPGHGRAFADSHLELPVVHTPRSELESTDFAPFVALAQAPMAMTAHVVFSDIDPGACATVSRKVTQDIIRGHIGFDGLLMSDDLSMKALGGSFAERTKASLDAGSDLVLHCNGQMAEMAEVAEACPWLEGKAAERAQTAKTCMAVPDRFDPSAADAKLAQWGLAGKAA
jgi:beta-N-acetylhexosaminidase